MKRIILILIILLPVLGISQTKIMKYQLAPLEIDTTETDINKANWEEYLSKYLTNVEAPDVFSPTYPAFKLSEAFTPAVIRNMEGDNISDYYTTSKLIIRHKELNVITLNDIPENLMIDNVNWYIISLDDSNTGSINWAGDYLVKAKVLSTDNIKKQLTLSSSNGFDIGDKVMLYSPFTNYEFLDGQESAPSISKVADTYMSTYVAAGPMWWDNINNRYTILLNGKSPFYQIGFAYSTDLINWTHGNNHQPIITNAENPHFAHNVYSTGAPVELDNNRVGVYLTCFDASEYRRIYYAEMNRDATGLIIHATPVMDDGQLMNPSVVQWDNKYHMMIHRRGSPLENSKTEHYASLSLTSGWTKLNEFSYNGSNSIWMEGVGDNYSVFVENGGLYALVGGTSRYIESGTRADRVLGLMSYDKTYNRWSPANKFAPEIIAPMYFQDMGEPWGVWAGSHTGGYSCILRHNNEYIMSLAFERTADNYGIGFIRLRNNRSQYMAKDYVNFIPHDITGSEYNVNDNLNATITLTGNAIINLPELIPGETGNMTVRTSTTGYILKLSSSQSVKIADYIDHTDGNMVVDAYRSVFSWYYDGIEVFINRTNYD